MAAGKSRKERPRGSRASRFPGAPSGGGGDGRGAGENPAGQQSTKKEAQPFGWTSLAAHGHPAKGGALSRPVRASHNHNSANV